MHDLVIDEMHLSLFLLDKVNCKKKIRIFILKCFILNTNTYKMFLVRFQNYYFFVYCIKNNVCVRQYCQNLGRKSGRHKSNIIWNFLIKFYQKVENQHPSHCILNIVFSIYLYKSKGGKWWFLWNRRWQWHLLAWLQTVFGAL